MTIKELYELAKTLGAEEYEIEIVTDDGNGYCPTNIDSVWHERKIVYLDY